MDNLQNSNFKLKKLGKYYVIFGIVILPLLFVLYQDDHMPVYEAWSNFLMVLGLGVSFATMAYFLIVAFLAYCYKPSRHLSDDELPTCSVIVPAYNEGKQVLETIESLLNCDYPKEKMNIIAVDDGSKDDTAEWIKVAGSRYPEQVSIILLERNGGKKHALYQAIKTSRDEIIVTVDSDSLVAKDAVRNIMGFFVADPQVGGVAGNIRIKNMDGGAIPKMLDVAFAFGFEFMRCAQSFIGTVLCTPGALSAYRRSAVMPVLDTWLNQTFMGLPSTIGEDRAITSLLIRSGNKVLFQNDAYAFTDIPTTYCRTCRMLIRWTRSDVRENLAMTRFAFSNISKWNWQRIGLQINLIAFNLGIFLPILFLPTTVAFIATHIHELPHTLTYCCFISTLWAAIPAMIYADRYSARKSLWAFAYGIFAALFLSWIPVFSVFTVRNGSWMTRELKEQGRESEEKAITGEAAHREA